MRLNPLSDLHLQYQPMAVAPANADLRIVAGDWDLPEMDPAQITPFLDLDVLGIPGNHDFDGMTLEDGKEAWTRLAHDANALAGREGRKGRLTFIADRGVAVFGPTRFVCCTLWTDIDRGDPLAIQRLTARITKTHRPSKTTYKVTALSDFDRIKGLTPEVFMAEHRRHRAFLEETLAEPFEGRTVVVTHHAPSWHVIDERFRGSPLNAAYASNLDHLIGGPEVSLWQHGHMHYSIDRMLGDTRVLCNPRGYDDPDEGLPPNPGFHPGLVVEP